MKTRSGNKAIHVHDMIQGMTLFWATTFEVARSCDRASLVINIYIYIKRLWWVL